MDNAKTKTRFANRRCLWLLVFAVLALLYFFAPDQNNFYPRCLFHSFTGWDCPGCGALRATHQLLHGNFVTAFALNPLFILLLPFFAIFGACSMLYPAKTMNLVLPKIWFWLGVAGLVTFTVSRNLLFPLN